MLNLLAHPGYLNYRTIVGKITQVWTSGMYSFFLLQDDQNALIKVADFNSYHHDTVNRLRAQRVSLTNFEVNAIEPRYQTVGQANKSIVLNRASKVEQETSPKKTRLADTSAVSNKRSSYRSRKKSLISNSFLSLCSLLQMKAIDVPKDGNCLLSAVYTAYCAATNPPTEQPALGRLMTTGVSLRLHANDVLSEIWQTRDQAGNDGIITLSKQNIRKAGIRLTENEREMIIETMTFNELRLAPEDYLRAQRVYGQQCQGPELIALSLYLNKKIATSTDNTLNQLTIPCKVYLAFEEQRDEDIIPIRYDAFNFGGLQSGHFKALVPVNSNYQVYFLSCPI